VEFKCLFEPFAFPVSSFLLCASSHYPPLLPPARSVAPTVFIFSDINEVLGPPYPVGLIRRPVDRPRVSLWLAAHASLSHSLQFCPSLYRFVCTFAFLPP